MKIFFFALLAIAAAGCNNNSTDAITDDPIYAKFEVSYNESSVMSTGKATFFKGYNTNTPAVFSTKASLTVNNLPLSYQSGAIYTKDFPGFPQTYTFKVADVNKKEFINSIGVYDIQLPVGNEVQSSKRWTIAWTSRSIALDSGEVVTVRIGTQAYTQDSTGAKSITIDSTAFTSLRGKTYGVTIERLKTRKLDQSLGGGGTISGQYIAQPKSILFK